MEQRELSVMAYCKECKEVVLFFDKNGKRKQICSTVLTLEEAIKLLRLLVDVFPTPVYCCIVSALVASIITSPLRAIKSFVAMLTKKFGSLVKKHTNKKIAKFNLLNKFFHKNRVSGKK